MTPADITRIIEADLARECLNWSGRPLRDCLRIPTKITVGSESDKEGPEEVWLVFDESKTPEEGYRVIFDEEMGKFGLAVAGCPYPVVSGLYGGFIETLHSM